MNDELAIRFAQHIAALEKRLRAIESGTRAPQLSNASLDLDSGKGYIPIKSGGVERARIGRQPDGTISFTSSNNPVPPNAPVPIQVEPILAGAKVTVYGIEGEQPYDFNHCNIYCDGNIVATVTALPGTAVVAPLDYEPHGFWATTVNMSGMESPVTDPVYATPLQAVSADLTAGIISALHIADEAITQAKIAIGAIGTEQIGEHAIELANLADGSVDARTLLDDAVTTDKIAASAVVAEAIAANAVIAGKIAAGSVTAEEIAALTIQAGNIAAEAIVSEKIAADAITAREIAALSIIAEHLQANSVTAGAIEAGAITAEKLEADLVVTNRIICGYRLGARLELAAEGLSQYSDDGSISLQFGANPQGGNFLTIMDPEDNTKALAGIGIDGGITGQSLSALNSISIAGEDLAQNLAEKSAGIIAWGTMDVPQRPTTGRLGLLELAAPNLRSDRMYRLATSPIQMYGGRINLIVTYTIDGSVPTTAHPMFTAAAIANLYTGQVADIFTPDADDTTYRFLFGIEPAFGDEGYANTPYSAGLRVWVEDIGPALEPTGGVVIAPEPEDPPPPPPPVTYSTYYPATWSSSWNSNDSPDMYHGDAGWGLGRTFIGFDDAKIRADTAGATISHISLHLYAHHWWFSSGGTVVIGTHNDSYNGPGCNGLSISDYPAHLEASFNRHQYHMGRGEARWEPLPVAIGYELRDGICQGIMLNPGGGLNRSMYGQFASPCAAGGRPQLWIKYTK